MQTGLSKVGSIAGGAMKVVGGAIAGATAAVGAFGASAVSAGMSFDSAMAQVAATSGKSMEQLNSEVVTVGDFTGTLRDFAQEMGATTAFSATQSAEALNYMALAGYDATTSVQMLPQVMNLAAAGSMDLARASDMLTDAQTALGLTIPETEQMVNKMATAAANSNTSVEQLGDAILTVGGTAKTLKGGTTELTTVLGKLADNGIKGAEAGTHLRNIMLAMNPTTDAAANAWESLGVQAYDAEGNLRPLQDTFQDLSKAMEGMTDQQKTQLIQDMFNKTDLASVNALLSTTSEQWSKLSDTIDKSAKSTAASDMAKTQLENLSGAVTYFKSALEGVQIAVSDQLTPTLVEFVNLGTDGLSRLTEAFKNDGISGAMQVLGDVISEALAKIIEKLPQAIEAGMSLLSAVAEGIISNLPMIMDAAGQIISMLGSYIVQNSGNILQTGIDIMMMLVNSLISAIPQLIPAAVQMIQNLSQALLSNLDTIISAAVELVVTLANSILDNIDQMIDVAIELILKLAEGLILALPQLMEKAPEIIAKLVMALIKAAPKLLEAALELMATLGKGIIQFQGEAINAILKVIPAIIQKFKETDWKEIGRNIMEGLKNGLLEKLQDILDTVKDIAGKIIDSAKGILGIHSPSKKFAWLAEMCIAGMDEEFEDYDPYETLNKTFAAGSGTLQASLYGSTGNVAGMDYSSMGSMIENALRGMAVVIDGRTAGRLLAQPVNDALGAFALRRV